MNHLVIPSFVITAVVTVSAAIIMLGLRNTIDDLKQIIIKRLMDGYIPTY